MRPKVKTYMGTRANKGPKLIITEVHKKGMTKQDVRKMVKNIIQKIGDNNKGRYSVSLPMGDKWRSGKLFKESNNISLFDPDDFYDKSDKNYIPDPGKYNVFTLYFLQDKKNKGGESPHNDCFYECPTRYIPAEFIPFNPKQLKKKLGLKRDDEISVSDVPLIEKLLGEKYRINILGDHIYQSTINSKMSIDIVLENGHFSIPPSRIRIQKGCPLYPKEPLVFTFNDIKGVVNCFDGQSSYYEKKDKFLEMRKKPRTAPYILIEKHKDLSLKETYKKYVKEAKEIEKKTNGMVNPFVAGDWRKTALKFFYDLTNVFVVEPIKQIETQWIEEGRMGPLVWCQKGYEGKGYEFDFVSMYPSILADKNMMFPIKEGRSKYIEELPKELDYGYYICKIKKSDDPTINRQFRFNCFNCYTHIDIKLARYLGLRIILIQEKDKPNAYIYKSSSLVSGKDLFGKYVNTLFRIKQEGIECAKTLLNILWGALFQKDKFKIIKKLGETIELYPGREVLGMGNITDDRFQIELGYKERVFESDFARLVPFLLAKARYNISTVSTPIRHKIVRLHTDGFLAKKDISSKIQCKMGDNLGDMKLKKYFPNAIVVSNIEIKGKSVKM